MGSKKKALLEAISKFHQAPAVTAAVVEEPVEATKLAADPVDTDEEPIGEIQVSEYLIFTLALDTYGRYLEETSGQEDAEDALLLKGIHILRSADLQSQDDVKSFMTGHLGTEAHKKMLARAFLIRTSGAAGLSKRALQLRTILSRGGASTMRGIFQTNKALKQMREAMSASILDNADAALDVFAAIPLRNLRMAKWIDEAAALAGTGNVVLNPVSEGTKSAIDAAPDLLVKSMQELASASAEGSREADIQRTEALTQIQANAEEQARKALEKSSEEDRPLLRSEVIGVATATAVAVMTDPSNPRNIPETLRGLDDDQLAAALTDGKVSVHAGAGGGKSSTIIARVAYLVKDRGVNPSRIMVTSFNNRAASELKEKIGKAVGDSALDLMTVGTMHSIFGEIARKFGTASQKKALNNRIGDGSKVLRALSKVFGDEQKAKAEAGAPEESILPTPTLKQVSMFISRWSGSGTTPKEALDGSISKAETASAIIYGRYLMAKKGTYRPASPSNEWARFQNNLSYPWSDFSDMISVCRDVLTQNPVARAQASQMFEHVIVDEAQDRNRMMSDVITLIQGGISQDAGKSLWVVGDSKQSINAFQGADSELFSELYNKEDWNTRLIKTNYRCEPEIVDAGNRLISSNPEAAMFSQVADPKRQRGSGSIQVSEPENDTLAAFVTIEEIKKNEAMGDSLTSHAVLCRTNNELHAYETACILRGVPYARKGAGSVFGSPESQAVLAFVDLATSTDTTKTHKALAQAIITPNKFFLKREDAEAACKAALSAYARTTRSTLNTVDPTTALRTPLFKSILSEEINRFQKSQWFHKGGQNRAALDTMSGELDGLMSNINAEPVEGFPPFSTTDMLDQILTFRGVELVDGKSIDKTFGDIIQVNVSNRVGDDDTDDEATINPDPALEKVAKLGAVGYLYTLSNQDPTDDMDVAYSPVKPANFAAKMDRYAKKASDLRTDITAWNKVQEGLPSDQRKPPPGAYLSTVHSTKGSEWKNVFVQMPRGLFPMIRKPSEDTILGEEYYAREDKRMKDERRLGYVAVTRAMKNLRIVCPQAMGKFKAGVSPYVADAGLSLGENINPPGKADPSGMADAVDPETEVVSNNDADGLPPKTASYAEPDEGDYQNYWLDSGEF